jgi:hypothetical protein
MRNALIKAIFVMSAWICALSPCAARDRALVVGINHYSNITVDGVHGVNDLNGAVPDAKSFAKALVQTFKFDPADIKLLTDQDATKAAILSGFEDWLIAGSRPGDRVVFYFAGHGGTAEVKEGPTTRKTSTIIPSDTSGDFKRDIPFINMIEGRTIGSFLKRLKDRRVTVFADSCHSGSVTRDLGGAHGSALIRTISPRVPIGMTEADLTTEVQVDLKTNPQTELIDRSIISNASPGTLAVWNAAGLDQFAFDLPDKSGGFFTQTFLKELRELNIENNTDPSWPGKLIADLKRKSETFCSANTSSCIKLTPNLEPEAAWRNVTLSPTPLSPAGPATNAEVTADAISLLSHKNDFQLAVEILPGSEVKLNDIVKFRITAAEAGTLVVLDAGPDGKLRQIYPNKYGDTSTKTGLIRAGAPTTIPDSSYGFVFRAKDAGHGQLLVLVADKALDLSGIVGKSLDGKPEADPRGIVVELAQKIQTPMITPDLTIPNGSYRWAFKAVPYDVMP